MAVSNPPILHAASNLKAELIQYNCITVDEARNSIKTKFIRYRQLLDKKELELLAELDKIESNNIPELKQVKTDLERLYCMIPTMEDSLGTNTLKLFLEEQKSLFNKQISHYERSKNLLTHVNLKFSEFDKCVEKIIEIIPLLSKAKYRTELEPLLELEPQLNEDWYLVPKSWFVKFADSINLYDPQPNDSWEFPEPTPIDHSDLYTDEKNYDENECKLLHSKAWELLLGFNGISPGSVPLNRTFFDENKKEIIVPICPISHKLLIGYYIEGNLNTFHIEGILRTFPYETYQDILEKVSGFSKLYTNYSPKLYCFETRNSVSWDDNNKRYTNSRKDTSPYYSTSYRETPSIQDLTSQIGLEAKTFLLVIPNTLNETTIQVCVQIIYM